MTHLQRSKAISAAGVYINLSILLHSLENERPVPHETRILSYKSTVVLEFETNFPVIHVVTVVSNGKSSKAASSIVIFSLADDPALLPFETCRWSLLAT